MGSSERSIANPAVVLAVGSVAQCHFEAGWHERVQWNSRWTHFQHLQNKNVGKSSGGADERTRDEGAQNTCDSESFSGAGVVDRLTGHPAPGSTRCSCDFEVFGRQGHSKLLERQSSDRDQLLLVSEGGALASEVTRGIWCH